jgi:hypothetical protein
VALVGNYTHQITVLCGYFGTIQLLTIKEPVNGPSVPSLVQGSMGCRVTTHTHTPAEPYSRFKSSKLLSPSET